MKPGDSDYFYFNCKEDIPMIEESVVEDELIRYPILVDKQDLESEELELDETFTKYPTVEEEDQI
eukprot:CAMPEP_0168610766 /NCGR_PEP_ID=MMETSP0449_2-20121227/1971_1 /TAXON_ID=1082188 /ORGANISM="Strombidium rassoulzadegani, Strain ras09" /LENGTH=64 /DNA_ID=CAMNT_0008651111 /DNA_START=510 /DNA_END=704 /DNA_ORIENTATION=-